MKYYNSKADSDGYVHSIDNVIVTYHFKYSMKEIIEKIREISKKYECTDYWERLDCKPCSKFSYYSNDIHLDTGFYFQIGHYQLDYNDLAKKKYVTVPIAKMEVNPNKYRENALFDEVIDYFKSVSWMAEIKKVDYAVDIPVAPEKVKLYAGRKQAGLYKGTRYYGVRHKHGYVKIYDKKKESKLESDCTRIEYTLDMDIMRKKEFTFDEIYVHVHDELRNDVKMSSSLEVIADMCKVLESQGLNYEEYLDRLNYRTKKQIIEYLQGYGKKLEFDSGLFDDLMTEMRRIFAVDDINSGKGNRDESAGFVSAPVEEKIIDEFVEVTDEELEDLFLPLPD